MDATSNAALDVLAERNRQIDGEKFDAVNDDAYRCGELIFAAISYARSAAGSVGDGNIPSQWPWNFDWWKPSTPRRDLVKAAALLLAEIERLDRADPLAPVAPAAAEPKMVAACCGRSECGGECGNDWRGMVPAQPDERAAYLMEAAAIASTHCMRCAELIRERIEAGATAPQAKFECAARKQGSVGGNDPADCDWPVCGCDEHANKVIGSLEESDALKSTPIYQIGAPGIAGHQVVWWDVPQEEYERQKKAGFMRTGIVYREGE